MLCALAAAQVYGLDLSTGTRVENPRAFGHFLGDQLTQDIQLTVPRPYSLVRNALPRPGRTGTWLELTQVSVRSVPTLGGTRYELVLGYQIVNSPLHAEVATLPALHLDFTAPGNRFEKTVDEWPIAIAPLSPGAIRTGLEEMRPARAPRLIDATPTEIRLTLFAAASGALFAFLAIARWGVPGLARWNGPFARASRTLRGISRDARRPDDLQTALRTVHRAFDQTAGHRLFGEHVSEFLDQHAQLRDLREDIQRFFGLSQEVFFGQQASIIRQAPIGQHASRGRESAPADAPQRIAWLSELCVKCRARERQAAPGTS
jgi:mxaA protein